MSRVLVIGGNSNIARAYLSALQPDANTWEVVVTDRKGKNGPKLDLSDVTELPSALTEDEFDLAIVFAAMANLKACEEQPLLARQVNCDSLVELTQRLPVTNWIVFSTNLVFNGEVPHVDHNSEYSPFNQYGLSKATMEQSLLSALPDRVAVVRMTKVITEDFPLLDAWMRDIAANINVEVFKDMNLAPISVYQVIEFLLSLSDEFKPGVFHLSGATDVSYYTMLRTLAEHRGLNPDVIHPVEKTVDSPRFTSLKVTENEAQLGFTAPALIQVLAAK